jgi:hypothetical protein
MAKLKRDFHGMFSGLEYPVSVKVTVVFQGQLEITRSGN